MTLAEGAGAPNVLVDALPCYRISDTSCDTSENFGGASRTPVAEGGGALWRARRSIYHPAKKGAHLAVWGTAPAGVAAPHDDAQVAQMVVRMRSHPERVGNRLGSAGSRFSQRNSTRILGTLPLMHEAQHSAAT